MERIVFKGKSVEEAVSGAAKVLGVEVADLEYRVISEGKAAVLGILGGKETEIEAWKKLPLPDEAKEMMQTILNKMGLLAVAEAKLGDQGEVNLDVKGEDLGQIIGKDGANLAAFQTIVSTALSHRHNGRVRVYMDAGGYKAKQYQAIERIANEAAEDVVSSGQEKILPPMTSGERRVVHLALANNPKVTTHSEGEGADRRLIISPK